MCVAASPLGVHEGDEQQVEGVEVAHQHHEALLDAELRLRAVAGRRRRVRPQAVLLAQDALRPLPQRLHQGQEVAAQQVAAGRAYDGLGEHLGETETELTRDGDDVGGVVSKIPGC